PTFSHRRHTRRYRLMRTLIAIAAVIAVVAIIIGKLAGGGPGKEPPTPQTNFVATVVPETDAARAPKPAAVQKERDAIKKILDDWFQTAFVDPKKFGDGSFKDAESHFAKEARDQFRKDIPTLTIGETPTD